jgi:hypothetical protein
VERDIEELLTNMVPLKVGDLQLNESVKVEFSRQLIKMYLRKQLSVVKQLRNLLLSGERGCVSSKITLELLEDVSGRLETFVALMTLKSSLDISTIS